MGTVPVFASAGEAMEMVRAGLGYLVAADAAQLPAATQADCLKVFEQDAAVPTAARAWFLAAFTAGQGSAGDGAYSAGAWLIHRTGSRRALPSGIPRGPGARPPPEGPGRAGRRADLGIGGAGDCLWASKLPQEHRDASDTAAGCGRRRAGAGGAGGAVRAAVRAVPVGPARSGPRAAFEDREVKLATTFGGAGVLHGDLTAGCAGVVGPVLDALGAQAGKEDDRTKEPAVPRCPGRGDAPIGLLHREFDHIYGDAHPAAIVTREVRTCPLAALSSELTSETRARGSADSGWTLGRRYAGSAR